MRSPMLLTMAVCPCAIATCIGVLPMASCPSIGSPAAISSSATSLLPAWQAAWSAVWSSMGPEGPPAPPSANNEGDEGVKRFNEVLVGPRRRGVPSTAGVRWALLWVGVPIGPRGLRAAGAAEAMRPKRLALVGGAGLGLAAGCGVRSSP